MFEQIVKIALPLALIFVMIGVGISLELADFKRISKFPKAFFVGAFAQLILLPLLAIAVITAFGLSGALAMGVLIIALCPGGVTSNLFTYLAKGDVGLSVSLTAVIGFITPFTIPLVVNWGLDWQNLANAGFELPVGSTVIKLLVISVIPVLIGMGVRSWVKDKREMVESIVRKASSAVLGLVIIGLYFKLGAEKVNEYAVLAGPVCVAMNVIGMAMGIALALIFKLNMAQRICVMLEVGLQNGTIALLIATTILKSDVMSIAPVIYSLWMMVSATVVVFLSKRGRSGDDIDSSEMALDC